MCLLFVFASKLATRVKRRNEALNTVLMQLQASAAAINLASTINCVCNVRAVPFGFKLVIRGTTSVLTNSMFLMCFDLFLLIRLI